jgi:hypothetical protein
MLELLKNLHHSFADKLRVSTSRAVDDFDMSHEGVFVFDGTIMRQK